MKQHTIGGTRVTRSLVERAELVGPDEERDRALEFVGDGKYSLVRSGPFPVTSHKIDPTRFLVVAERPAEAEWTRWDGKSDVGKAVLVSTDKGCVVVAQQLKGYPEVWILYVPGVSLLFQPTLESLGAGTVEHYADVPARPESGTATAARTPKPPRTLETAMVVFFDAGHGGVSRVEVASLVGISYDRGLFTGEPTPWAEVETVGGYRVQTSSCYLSRDDAERAANPLDLNVIYALSGGEE